MHHVIHYTSQTLDHNHVGIYYSITVRDRLYSQLKIPKNSTINRTSGQDDDIAIFGQKNDLQEQWLVISTFLLAYKAIINWS